MKIICKLFKSCKQILLFLSDDEQSKIMKKISELNDWDKLSNGVQISHYFWIYGANLNTGVSLSAVQSRLTLLFHLIKKRWMLGPKIPENLLLFDSSATSLNSTHVVFIGAKKTTEDDIAYFFNQDLQTYVVVQFNMI